MHYHLVLVIKYRRKVLDGATSQFLKNMFVRIGKDYHVAAEEWEHGCDHIHVVFSARPTTELPKFVNSYKAASSRMVKKEFPYITEKLWKSHFWKTGFYISTTGGANLDTIKKYVQEQRGEMGHKSYKFRMFPTDEQAEVLWKTIGCARFMYNQILADRNLYHELYVDGVLSKDERDVLQSK